MCCHVLGLTGAGRAVLVVIKFCCARGFGAKLHLVRPLGFDLSDKAVKRAGLDYWKHVDLNVHESVDAFVTNTLPGFDKVVFLSKEEKYGCIPLTDCDLR